MRAIMCGTQHNWQILWCYLICIKRCAIPLDFLYFLHCLNKQRNREKRKNYTFTVLNNKHLLQLFNFHEHITYSQHKILSNLLKKIPSWVVLLKDFESSNNFLKGKSHSNVPKTSYFLYCNGDDYNSISVFALTASSSFSKNIDTTRNAKEALISCRMLYGMMRRAVWTADVTVTSYRWWRGSLVCDVPAVCARSYTTALTRQREPSGQVPQRVPHAPRSDSRTASRRWHSNVPVQHPPAPTNCSAAESPVNLGWW